MSGKKTNELKTVVDDELLSKFNRQMHIEDRNPSEMLRHMILIYCSGHQYQFNDTEPNSNNNRS